MCKFQHSHTRTQYSRTSNDIHHLQVMEEPQPPRAKLYELTPAGSWDDKVSVLLFVNNNRPATPHVDHTQHSFENAASVLPLAMRNVILHIRRIPSEHAHITLFNCPRVKANANCRSGHASASPPPARRLGVHVQFATHFSRRPGTRGEARTPLASHTTTIHTTPPHSLHARTAQPRGASTTPITAHMQRRQPTRRAHTRRLRNKHR
jgi:hypothetical protein